VIFYTCVLVTVKYRLDSLHPYRFTTHTFTHRSQTTRHDVSQFKFETIEDIYLHALMWVDCQSKTMGNAIKVYWWPRMIFRWISLKIMHAFFSYSSISSKMIHDETHHCQHQSFFQFKLIYFLNECAHSVGRRNTNYNLTLRLHQSLQKENQSTNPFHLPHSI